MELIWVSGKGAGFEHAQAVRTRVFVEEQGYALEGEFDETDERADHLVGLEHGEPVCTARMFEAEPGVRQVGRVAVQLAARGTGLGHTMMEAINAHARALGARCIVLDAQADKTVFYEKSGYVPTGRTSLDEGVPHVEMELRL